MTVLIKNCGLKTPEAIKSAAASGASFVGFVHHAPSPRHLALDAIAKLFAQTPESLKKVIVLVNPIDKLLDDVFRRMTPDFLQVHQVMDPKRLTEIRKRAPLITAISVRTKDDLTNVAALEAVSDHLLFDGKESGSGEAFDWALLSGLTLTKPWFLAGGLTTANVAEALAISHAPMVDVSSGIERSLGVKSLEKIAAFNEAVMSASH